MKIYTKTGDRGDTALFAGGRVRKCDPRIEAYGQVDELNALLGAARAASPPPPAAIETLLEKVQHDLFALGAELATPDPAAAGTDLVDAGRVEALEAAIDRFELDLPPLTQFILPAGAPAAAALHVARAVCRRVERRVVALADAEGQNVSPRVVEYLNRLGDLLFVLARAANAGAGQGDVPWKKDS